MDSYAKFVYDSVSECSLIAVTVLYSTAISVSTSLQNMMVVEEKCYPLIPFGECPVGEQGTFYQAQESAEVISVRFVISAVVMLLAGAWSDSHGRRRRPLIILSIIGQMITDGLFFWRNFLIWPQYVKTIITVILPGLFVGRNLFWIGVMSYVSENSTKESRTRKLGLLIASYTISVLMGRGVFSLLELWMRRNFLIGFFVPFSFSLIAVLIVYFFVGDSSESYNKNIVWMRPKYLLKGYSGLLKHKVKSFTVVLIALMICQSVLVARIAGVYSIIYSNFKHTFKWYDAEYVCFAVIKMMMIFFGTVFAIYMLGRRLKIHDLMICIIACTLDVIAAVLYTLFNQSWEMYLISFIDFFHGTAVVVTTSLLSKIVDTEELGRLYTVQTILNSLLTFGAVAVYQVVSRGLFYNRDLFSSVYLLNVVLTLPVIYVFKILYTKYHEFWTEDAAEIPQKPISVISPQSIMKTKEEIVS